MLTLKEIKQLIQEEEALDNAFLHLTANETILSPFAQRVLSSPLYNRYLLEHLDMRCDNPSRLNGFLFKGLNNVNKIEASAKEVCKRLFGAAYVEFRCISGLHAMMTTLAALTSPGDTIMRFSTKDGGHFATEHLIKLLGRKDCCYVVDRGTTRINLEKTKEVFEREKPRLLYIDAMNYVFPFPLKELKAMIGDVPLIFDASHTLGLIAGGQFQNPLAEGADIVQANTHKTLFGPQKGIILSNNRRLMEKICYSLTNGLVSSQHTTSLLALCIALHEMDVFGREFARQVILNAQFLARELEKWGLKILAASEGYTKNHQFFIDVTEIGSGPHILEKLLQAHLSVNRTMPFEHVDAIRVGVQEVTRRGYTREDFKKIAAWIAGIILHGADPVRVREEVIALVNLRRKIYFCEDDTELPLVNGVRIPQGVPRWIDVRQERNACDVPLSIVEDARVLGKCAATFEQQMDSAGNLGFKHGGRIFVTTSGSYLKDLQVDDFAELLEYKDLTIHYCAVSAPSSESLLHWLILHNTDSKVVVHNHYLPTEEEVRRHRIKVVAPKEYASIQLAESVADACKTHKMVFVEKHGIVVHGKDRCECLTLLHKILGRVRAEAIIK